MTAFAAAAGILREGIAAHAFPAAAVEVGSREDVLWREAFGTLGYDADAPPARLDTIFDLASLTKVIATTTLVTRAVDERLLELDERVSAWIPEWRGPDRDQVTLRDLLAHSSGLTAYLPYYRDLTGRAEFQAAIATSSLEYVPRTQAIYSDLGFILIGFILEDVRRRAQATRTGAVDPDTLLAQQFKRVASYVTAEPLTFLPPRPWRDRTAPTEHDTWRGRTLRGDVHDENAWALGGVAGHAGLFGTAAAVGAFARAMLHTLHEDAVLAMPETMRAFIQRTPVPGSSRALGWDTMRPTSSCGTLMSPTAIGHTGFTGTSLWIDWERDLYVVLLTNRVHPTRENTLIQQVRPRFHDAVMRSLVDGGHGGHGTR
jgi:CubicO group peptidase (beta-lactamase class C family)